MFALGCFTREQGSTGLVLDMEQKLLTRVLDLFSDFSPPAADLTVFTPQTLFSDTCCAPRKQVSVPLIRTQPCGYSAEKPPVECVVVCQRVPSAPGRCGVLVGTDLSGPVGLSAFRTNCALFRGQPIEGKAGCCWNGKAASGAMVSEGIRWIAPVVSLWTFRAF